ncbi:MAG: hypothetical protein IIB38_10550 [Candidatus Hydrogenedentes bacterium]|nr:hypothetical protein [Candidatus Hydrogenedentota bacterium]
MTWEPEIDELKRRQELARQMGARGRETAEEYRWERVACQVEEYYEHCLRSDNGHSWKRAS